MRTPRALVAALLFCCAVIPVHADDLFPPPWRGQPDTTMAHWTFDNQNNPLFPDQWNNPYGLITTPVLLGTYQYFPPPGVTGATSVGWAVLPPSFGSISFVIPNANEPPPHEKQVYIQIVYTGAINVQVTDPAGNVFAPFGPTSTPLVLPSGALYQSFSFTYPGCPPFETIRISNASASNNAFISQVVIDTICIPTPTSSAALALVGLAAARRRR